jgi:hypothetical protein
VIFFCLAVETRILCPIVLFAAFACHARLRDHPRISPTADWNPAVKARPFNPEVGEIVLDAGWAIGWNRSRNNGISYATDSNDTHPKAPCEIDRAVEDQ